MCIAFFLLDAHPRASAIITFNRDEIIDRPTKPLHFWSESPGLLAGRDLVGGGTWFGITKQGRFAFLTNYREKSEHNYTNSRGDLVTGFLLSDRDPLDYLQELKDNTEHYAGFNLVLGDSRKKQYGYYSNKSNSRPEPLGAGFYGLSNGLLMQWPKVERGLQKFKSIMSSWTQQQSEDCTFPRDELFDLLKDSQLTEEHLLPVTGWAAELELKMSSIFVDKFGIQSKFFGTRSQVVAVIWKDDHATAVERYLTQEEGEDKWKEQTIEFALETQTH